MLKSKISYKRMSEKNQETSNKTLE